jgi:hypothetical protein
MARNGSGCGVAWLALIVSLAALFLSWKAYERSGGRIEDLKLLDTKVSVGDESPPDWRSALESARESLAAARDQEDVARIRENLARSFRNAGEIGDVGDAARRRWRELDSDLERLQGQFKEGSSRAKETLAATLEKMKRIGS